MIPQHWTIPRNQSLRHPGTGWSCTISVNWNYTGLVITGTLGSD
jgi:hypothetical protein